MLACWNAEWARGVRAARILDALDRTDADVVCLTETYEDALTYGHAIASDPDYGYRAAPGRRKVVLWSHAPWKDVDTLGHPTLPGGRFVVGTTETPLGPLRLAGVCIPWRGAHVSTGRRDRGAWEDHLRFLDGLASVLDAPGGAAVVLGDFNQRIPKARQPVEVSERLESVLEGWSIPSAGDHAGVRLIDHVALRAPLVGRVQGLLPPTDADGRLTDHWGVKVGCSKPITAS